MDQQSENRLERRPHLRARCSLFRFHSEDEVIEAANATPFGLAAYFYSRDLARVMRISSQLQAELLGVNEGAISTELGPSGGVNESAYGGEGSKYGIDDHLQMKYLCLGGPGAVK
jgi:succinate-semialdehyde dehydrogenase/glutarate-semialdehyde dehydrogenase